MTNPASVGIDMLSIGRLEIALERRPGLASRLFTASELADCARRRRPARHLAARFCAKEASIKALDLRMANPLEIEVVGGRDHAPGIRLSGGAAEQGRRLGVELRLSLSHEGDMAAAVVVATAR